MACQHDHANHTDMRKTSAVKRGTDTFRLCFNTIDRAGMTMAIVFPVDRIRVNATKPMFHLKRPDAAFIDQQQIMFLGSISGWMMIICQQDAATVREFSCEIIASNLLTNVSARS